MSGDHFITPPPVGNTGEATSDPNVQLGSTWRLQWSTSYGNSSLWLLKDADNMSCKDLNLSNTWCHNLQASIQNTMQYDWTVNTYDMPYNPSRPSYYLELRSNPLLISNSQAIRSHYFNITSAQGSSSSTASSSISSSLTPTSSGTTAIATVLSSTGLSNGTKVAIGASVGIGLPLIAILLAILIVVTRRKRNRNNHNNKHIPSSSSTPTSMSDPYAPLVHTDMPYTPSDITKTGGTTNVYPRQEMEAPVHVPQQQQQQRHYQHQASPRWELPTSLVSR